MKFGAGDFVAGERMDDVDRDLDEGLRSERRDRIGWQCRPNLRHVKSAVARKPREKNILEPERIRSTPRRNIFQSHDLSADELTSDAKPSGANGQEQAIGATAGILAYLTVFFALFDF
jgi:hypothetical protein